jgi:hypothetical protein
MEDVMGTGPFTITGTASTPIVDVVHYPTSNPDIARPDLRDSIAMREYFRVKSVTVKYDGIILCHQDWRDLYVLSQTEQAALNADFRRMIGICLPWFTDKFTVEHAKIVSSVFPDREVWFDGALVTV